MPVCKYGDHVVYQHGIDWESSLEIAEIICKDCSPWFWKEYELACRGCFTRYYKTTGWVSCEVCKGHTQQALEQGTTREGGMRYYCLECSPRKEE